MSNKRISELASAASLSSSSSFAVVNGSATEKASFSQLISTLSVVNTFANRPAPGISGRVFTPTDGYCRFIDDGSAWRPIFLDRIGSSPPAASTFTAINSPGSLTVADDAGTLLITQTETGAGANYGMLAIPIPTAPYEIRIGFSCNSIPANDIGWGVGLRDSSSGRAIGGQLTFNTSTPKWIVQTFSSPTVVNSTPINDSFVHDFTINQKMFFHMKDPGGAGNLTWGITRDGKFNTIAAGETNSRTGGGYVVTPNQLVLLTNTANVVTGRGGLVLRIFDWLVF